LRARLRLGGQRECGRRAKQRNAGYRLFEELFHYVGFLFVKWGDR
jgi:hypothetical protein